MHSDSKKRRCFVALLFASGDAWRYVDFGSEAAPKRGSVPDG
jgi:hypothetical protein